MNDVVWVAAISAFAGASGTIVSVWNNRQSNAFHRERVDVDRRRDDWLSWRKFQIESANAAQEALREFWSATVMRTDAPTEYRVAFLAAIEKCEDDDLRRLARDALDASERVASNENTDIRSALFEHANRKMDAAAERFGEVLRELHAPNVIES